MTPAGNRSGEAEGPAGGDDGDHVERTRSSGPARRQILGTVGTVAAVGLAGCSAVVDAFDRSTGGDPDAEPPGDEPTTAASAGENGPDSRRQGRVIVRNDRREPVFATVAIANGDRTVASVTRAFPPGRTRLGEAAVTEGRYDVVVETEAGRRATGRWWVLGALGELVVRFGSGPEPRIRQPVACTPACPPVSVGGRVDPLLSAWPTSTTANQSSTATQPTADAGESAAGTAPRTGTGRRVSVVNLGDDRRTVDVEFDGPEVTLAYTYRPPPGVELRLPVAPPDGDLDVRVAAAGDAFAATLAPGRVALPLAIDADGVRLDCPSGDVRDGPTASGADLLVSVGAVGARLVETTAIHPGGEETARAVLVDGGQAELVEGFLDGPGVYDVTVRAWTAGSATYDAVGSARTTAVVCGRRRLRVSVDDEVEVAVRRREG